MNALDFIRRHFPLIARILMAQLFLIAGLGKVTAFRRTAAFMANSGLPTPELLLVLTIALEFVGATLLIIGWKARWAAAGLFGYTLIASIWFHPFWAAEPALVKTDLNDFMKNLAIMGGMLYIMAYGPGPLSLGVDDGADANANARARKKR